MFYKSKLLICFHSLIFLTVNVISAIFTYQNNGNVIDFNMHPEIRRRFYTYLLFIVLVMFVNMWEILRYWIDSREKEFYIYRLVGANRKQLVKRFVLDYIKITLVSVFLGVIFCFLFSLLPLAYSKVLWKSFRYIIGVLGASYVIPMLAGVIMLWRQQNVNDF